MAWYDPAFPYKKALTIPHTNVSGGADLLNFPVLVSLTDATLKSTANGGYVASSSGYDLLFTNGMETAALDYEVESYTASSGTLVCWVRLPVLSASVDTVIYLYFGKPNVTGFQAVAANVWKSAYIAVYHLSEQAGAATLVESTSNALVLTKTDTTHPTATTGEIAGGESFDGSTAKATASSSQLALTGDKTVEAWVNATSFAQDGGGVDRRFVFKNSDGTNVYQLTLAQTTNGFVWACNDGGGQHIVSSFNYSTGTWYHVVGTYTASLSSVALYVNGVQKSDGNASGWGIASAGNFALGYRTDGAGYFPGSLDEVRLSNVARTAGWIATEYSNQSNPSAFLTVGALISYSIPQYDPNALRAFALRTFGPVAYSPGGYLVLIGGLPVTIVATTLQIQSTVGRRSTASFVVKLPNTSVHYQQWQQVLIYDSTTTLVFSGYITDPVESRPSHAQTLLCTIQCADQHYLADKRRWASTYTNKTCGYIVHDLINNVLVNEGVTVGAIFDGLTPGNSLYPSQTLYPGDGAGLIAQANFTYDKSVAQILDDLTTAASSAGVPFYWMIDQFKQLWFVPYTYVVNNTLVDGSQIEAAAQPPTVERKNDLYRNTQYVMGGVAQTAQQTETRKGDGNTRAWSMGYALASAPTITKNGTGQTVGVKGSSGNQFYYQVGDATITQDSGQTVLSSSDTLQVVYTGQYPNIAISQNAAQVSYMAGIDGSSGIVELAVTDNTLTSATNALSEASSLLTRYSAQGTLLTFVTRNTGFAVGQLITVNLPTFGLNSTQMLIEEVDASDQQDGYTIWFTVKAVSGPYDVSWVDFFSSLLKTPTQAININANTTQTTQIAQSFTASLSPSASLSTSVYSCPLPASTLYPGTGVYPC